MRGGSRAGVLVAALAALIALAANGTPASAGRAVDRLEVLANVLVVGGAGLLFAVAAVYGVHRLTYGQGSTASFRTTLDRASPIVSLSLAGLLLLTIARTGPTGEIALGGLGSVSLDLPGIDRPHWSIRDSRTGLLAGADRREEASGEAADARTEVNPLLLLVVGAAFVGIVVWLARQSVNRASGRAERPRISPVVRPLSDAEAMHGAVLNTIDEMLVDPDPRRSIIGAYARLLEGVGASGAPRRDHEAPLEHLQRALSLLRVRPGPLRQLTDLFEVARFSEHPLTTSHRDLALNALHAAAEDLTASSGSVPAARTGPGAPGTWR